MIDRLAASSDLADVRQLEAVGFRSWPSQRTVFDGTWALRLTANHTAKRLNSVNPLDRGDIANLESRIALAAERFQIANRPLIFRLSPLAPPELEAILETRGWQSFDESIVMTADLDHMDLENVVDQLPLQNIERWIDQCIEMGSVSTLQKPGLLTLIAAVEGEVGLFLAESRDGRALSAAMAVRFGKLVGLFEVVADPVTRGQGHGKMIVKSALQWARKLGSKRAWLQVVSDNGIACGLYQSLGLTERYRYVYRQAPQDLTN